MNTHLRAIRAGLCALVLCGCAAAQAATEVMATNLIEIKAMVPWLNAPIVKGYTNQIQYSTDLTNWMVLTNLAVAETPYLTNQWFFDLDAPISPQRFYRYESFPNNMAVNQAPSFAKGDDQTVLEDAGKQTVEKWAANIQVGPSDESDQTATFEVSNSNNSLFTVPPAISPNGTLTFTPAINANGSATVTVFLKDSGGTANGGNDTSARTAFTITVTPVNDPPSFTGGTSQTLREDAGEQTLLNWAANIRVGPTDESGQTVTFLVSNSDNSLFAVQPTISPSGTLTYTLATNANGSATVTIYLQDNGGTANGGNNTSVMSTFTITATPANDPPSFTGGPNQTMYANAIAQNVPNWATSISAGPSNESGQSVEFHVTNDNNSMFSVQPAISANGTLTFTPAANASGKATVTVYLQDNGATADGGHDTSASSTFTVTLNQGFIPAGVFKMGDSQNDRSIASDAPPHQIYVSGFFMDTNLVSYALWTSVYNWAANNGYEFSNPGTSYQAIANYPVASVAWYDAVKWCNARSEKEGNLNPCYYTSSNHTPATVYRKGKIDLAASYVDWTASGYRLPTEAEWEKAARGGPNNTNRFGLSQTIDHTSAWYTSPKVTHPFDLGPYNVIQTQAAAVGSFKPNGFGLFDMAGNVREWCWDWYSSSYYTSSPPSDARGPASGTRRVMRGGCWATYASSLRCANREFITPSLFDDTIGFRCVRKQ